jgi:outer membrane biosynthesis protein TonB
LRDHSHTYVEDSDVCSHCGQPLPRAAAPTYGRQGPNRYALAGTIALHLLLVAIYFFKPEDREKQARPAGDKETDVVFVAPLQQPKPQQREQAPRPTPKPTTKKSTPRPQPEQVQVQRLPDTITLPEEKPAEVAKPQPKTEVPPDMDMAAYIEARRKQRGAPTGSEQPQEESEAARGTRQALANIAAINGRGREDRNETGGIFSVSNKTFHSMDLRFRGWNPNFKRRWLTQVTVEQGSEPDVETAVVKKMIELIRREKTGDFEWDSHRLGRVVTLSARPQDTDELMAFLFKEMFPEYRPPRR